MADSPRCFNDKKILLKRNSCICIETSIENSWQLQFNLDPLPLNSKRRYAYLVEQLSSISYPSLIMTKIFNNLSETIGVFSAFVVFFILKSIGASEFLAFPLSMLLGFGDFAALV